MDLLELLAGKDDPGVKPVEVSLAQLRKLMAAGSEGASLRFTSIWHGPRAVTMNSSPWLPVCHR